MMAGPRDEMTGRYTGRGKWPNYVMSDEDTEFYKHLIPMTK
jgi:hypothetical protein